MTDLEEKFYHDFIEKDLQNFVDEITDIIDEKSEIVQKKVLDTLKQLVTEANEPLKIRYIYISLLKNNIIEQSYDLLIQAYGEKLFLEPGNYVELSIKDLFVKLDILRNDWHQESKKYMGKIRNRMIENVILDKTGQLEIYLSYFFTQWLWQWEQSDTFKSLSQTDKITVYFGDYKNTLIPVYAYG